ncbi:hypothetical protein EHW97_10270 [Aeromicrobium camelliae]|uniref:Flp family type IVb pilin n=1 Tax=Aeromicrobium camelliae TaxID=1538144 RepID=A0A3N6YZP1_9ACTN|nr:hypothetical protein [Aeromicrobium camelliae]RQN03271.1 hypothetical protein EHW97_10270 [Aeromicrobium camelliae]
MDKLIALYATLTSMVAAPRDKEEGQGTLEYVGIVIVAGILVTAIVTALGGGDTISSAITSGINKITSLGG